MNIKSVFISGVLVCAAWSSQVGAAALPHAEFDGVWQVMGKITHLQTVDGKSPPLLPSAQQQYDQHRQAFKKGDHRFDSVTQCQPPGVPRVAYETMPFEIMVQKKQVVLMYQWNRLARFVDIDKAHSEPLGPTFLGQSVGRWEGNTLVVDTNGFGDMTLLDAEGLPHSDQLHVIERYTLSKNGQQLDARITIEDPQTFSKAWDTQVSFKRLKNAQIEEDVCVERLQLDQYK
ncbi:MAG: hypothetical protein QM808_14425 [Steroidobacteraceae bacterium]